MEAAGTLGYLYTVTRAQRVKRPLRRCRSRNVRPVP